MTTGDQVDERILAVIEPRWDGHARDHSNHDKLHSLQHEHEQELSRHAETRLAERNDAHAREHVTGEESVGKALAEVAKLADLHAIAHAREHLAHEQRHADARLAVEKADVAMDKRLAGLNEFREQLREQARQLASTESVDALRGEMTRRLADMTILINDKYETNRQRIETIEKGDVKAEGKSLGQGATVALIVGAISLVGTVLGIIIVVSNLATGG